MLRNLDYRKAMWMNISQLRQSPLMQRLARSGPVRALQQLLPAPDEIGILQGEVANLRGSLGTLQSELGTVRGELSTVQGELARTRSDLEATERYMRMHGDRNQWPSFADMSEVIDDPLRPPLDRLSVDEQQLTPRQRFWRENGYLILENFLPQDAIDAYVEVRKKWQSPGGWACPTPYMHVPEILGLSLHPPLLRVMEEIFGGEMVLHLNLTGWISTERDWHQDDYLNPPVINGWYIASWMALEDIHPDCGPFQFVPGSHRWPTLRQEKVRSFLPPIYARAEGRQFDYGHWTSWSQDFVSEAVNRQIAATGLVPKEFLGKKGDVLLWHACLAHRGSTPRVPGTPRKALISHYSEIEHRVDFPPSLRLTHSNGGKYQDFKLPLY
jgi:hypothetical protein